MKISGIQKYTLLDYPGYISCIVFLAGCNFRCGYCHNSEFVLPEKLREIKNSFINESSFWEFLHKRQGLLEGVVISGGEPTIWSDLPDFIKKIKSKGFLVKLDTNGSNPELLSFIIENKLVDYIAMDFKTSLELYPDLVGHGGNSDNIKKTIKLILNSDIDYEFRSTLVKEIHSVDTLQSMAKQIKGARKLFLQGFRPQQTLDKSFENYNSFSKQELHEIAKTFFTPYVDMVDIRV